jgi:nicotinate-nucleotide--dimethylbenzimidazole phosphoribosyltransferase
MAWHRAKWECPAACAMSGGAGALRLASPPLTAASPPGQHRAFVVPVTAQRRGDIMDIAWTGARCPEASAHYRAAAAERQAQLTKPAGSLGRLEKLAIDLAGLQQTGRPRADRAPIVIFAGDHGVTAAGVSAFPSEVTVQMLANFAGGGAAIAVLARELGQPLTLIDAGTLADGAMPGVLVDKPRRGTRDFSQEPALEEAELAHALACGRRAVDSLGGAADLLLLGEMGIGNTTCAAAIICALTGGDPLAIAGAGTGLDDTGRRRKAAVIAEALQRHGLAGRVSAPDAVLRAVGGLEVAALTGAIVAAAQQRIPVLVDGFIVSAAALAAVRLNPSCRPWLIFSHRSAEQGHMMVLDALDAEPLLDLNLRLGEGSGAALALPLVRLACALHNGMVTFAEAAVSNRS